MTVDLRLHTDAQGRLTVTQKGTALNGPIPLADLPTLRTLQAAPYDVGGALTEALGGDALLDRLRADPDRTLILEADGPAAAVPWEFAAVDGRQLLACRRQPANLVGWADALAAAEDYGMAAHHRTFTVAFDRSYRRLPPAQQGRLRALSRFPFPFFAQGAALLMWGMGTSDEDVEIARRHLHDLTRRSLLEVEATFERTRPPPPTGPSRPCSRP